MPSPFLLRIHGDDLLAARRLADAIETALALRDARFRLDVFDGLDGLSVAVAVSDAEGPRWLPPMPADDDPQEAARRVVAYLESWGFIARRAAPPPAS